MTSVKTQVILFWITVGFCFLGSLSFIGSLSFNKERLLGYGRTCSYLALLPAVTALVSRWMEVGHIPSISQYEVFTIYAVGILLFYVLVQTWKTKITLAGTLVLPIVMLLIGIGIMSSKELTQLPTTYFTYWLGIHMLFATLSMGGVLTAAGIAVVYLLKNTAAIKGKTNSLLAKLPDLVQLDYLGYRFTLFSFLMIGIMIASGSIWAYKFWGRYWGWDPIETWSLISWLAYGLYLHLRISGLKRQAAAWVHLVVILLVVFSFFGAPYLYPTIHDRFSSTPN